ncbi:MAG: RnfABCDGE type electron transport complex subunit B [Sedimentisphaerales bacterium]|nr:RnfABCDGE type electron transport complex subunit B [Sedimentisphaerales bacterium]
MVLHDILLIANPVLAAINIGSVFLAGFILLAAALIFVVILTIASVKLKIEQDPTVEAILNVLPGANCGGCGLAGCGAYAEAVARDHGLMGKCGPGGEQTVREIAAILGIEAAASAPVRAVVHCSAKTDDKINSTRYHGVITCSEGQMVAGVMGCPYGCMGFGDCSRACEFDAIRIIDGLAVVNYEKCVGCGACARACPRQLIEMLPLQEDPMMVIACATLDKAKEVRSYCKVGCVGCGLCAKLAPNMFQMQQNLAVIDYEKYGSKEERDKAQGKCPRAMMVYVGTKAETMNKVQEEVLETMENKNE